MSVSIDLMSIDRRAMITGLVSLVAAPAIVRASSLMPVRAPYREIFTFVDFGKGDFTVQSWLKLVEEKWCHLAVVKRDGGSMKRYIDGRIVARSALPMPIECSVDASGCLRISARASTVLVDGLSITTDRPLRLS